MADDPKLRRAGARPFMDRDDPMAQIPPQLQDGQGEPERSPLDLASGFLGDHQVVELLAAGAEPLFTISALRVGDRVQVVATLHTDDPDLVRTSTYAVLNACGSAIDLTDGMGEAAKALFVMAIDGVPEPTNEETR